MGQSNQKNPKGIKSGIVEIACLSLMVCLLLGQWRLKEEKVQRKRKKKKGITRKKGIRTAAKGSTVEKRKKHEPQKLKQNPKRRSPKSYIWDSKWLKLYFV